MKDIDWCWCSLPSYEPSSVLAATFCYHLGSKVEHTNTQASITQKEYLYTCWYRSVSWMWWSDVAAQALSDALYHIRWDTVFTSSTEHMPDGDDYHNPTWYIFIVSIRRGAAALTSEPVYDPRGVSHKFLVTIYLAGSVSCVPAGAALIRQPWLTSIFLVLHQLRKVSHRK